MYRKNRNSRNRDSIKNFIRNKVNYIAVFAFFLLLVISGVNSRIKGEADTNTVEYDIVVLGDSIYGLTRDETSIPAKLEQYLGKEVYNGALGGTCMGRLGEQAESTNMKDVLSMVSLSKAIVSGDFRLQENVKLNDNGTEYFAQTLAELKEIDFSKVEILLISHCVNDYHAGEVIGAEAGNRDEHTFAGALRSAVQMLQRAYPDLRIILVTPPYTWYTLQGLTCEEYVLGGNVLEDYVNAELIVAEELGVEVIDLYHDVFPHEEWEDWQIYSADGLHPNEEGRELLAQIIAEYLLTVPDA